MFCGFYNWDVMLTVLRIGSSKACNISGQVHSLVTQSHKELHQQQGLYSGLKEIWTATKTAKNGDKSVQFNNFPAQAARKLTKSGQNRNRFYQFPTQISLSNFSTDNSKIGTK